MNDTTTPKELTMIEETKDIVFEAAGPSTGYGEIYRSQTMSHLRQAVKSMSSEDHLQFRFKLSTEQFSLKDSGRDLYGAGHLYLTLPYRTWSGARPGYMHFNDSNLKSSLDFSQNLYLSQDHDVSVKLGVLDKLVRAGVDVRSVDMKPGEPMTVTYYSTDDTSKAGVYQNMLIGNPLYRYEVLDLEGVTPVEFEGNTLYASALSVPCFLRVTEIDMESWLNANPVIFKQLEPVEDVEYLYYYDLQKRGLIGTMEMGLSLTGKSFEEDVAQAKIDGYHGSDQQRIELFASPLPTDHLGWIFGGDHAVWRPGRVVYEHRIRIDDLPAFHFEIENTPEMIEYKDNYVAGKGRDRASVGQDIRLMLKFRGWGGSSQSALKLAVAPFVGLALKQFQALHHRKDADDIFDEVSPYVTKVYLYPSSEVRVDSIKKCIVGELAPTVKPKSVIAQW